MMKKIIIILGLFLGHSDIHAQNFTADMFLKYWGITPDIYKLDNEFFFLHRGELNFINPVDTFGGFHVINVYSYDQIVGHLKKNEKQDKLVLMLSLDSISYDMKLFFSMKTFTVNRKRFNEKIKVLGRLSDTRLILVFDQEKKTLNIVRRYPQEEW